MRPGLEVGARPVVGSRAPAMGERLWLGLPSPASPVLVGRADGLQQASQCEPQLRRLLEERVEKLAGEKQKNASGRDGCEDASPSPGNGPVQGLSVRDAGPPRAHVPFYSPKPVLTEDSGYLSHIR